MSGDANHSLAGSNHVGGIRMIEHPRAAFFTQVLPDIGLFRISEEHMQLLARTCKVGSAVRMDLLSRPSQSEESPCEESSCGDSPRAEHIKSHRGEGWLCVQTIRG